MTQRIGVLTGGGDCPGLNTVIRSVVKAAAIRGWVTTGVLGGFEGLLEPIRARRLDYHDMDGLLVRGGTVLGTTSSGPFTARTGSGDERRVPAALLHQARAGLERLGVEALVCIGGDGTLSIAQQLFEAGVPLVGVPKTIDNDLEATVMTFGFDSAVACAVDALDRLATTAASHQRVMVLEVMGRHSGWIAAYAGLAGGADVILIPEIPFDYDSVCANISRREAEGKTHTLVIVAEGAHAVGAEPTLHPHAADDDAGSERLGEARLGGIGAAVAREIARRTGKESRFVVLGHLQRGGSPSPMDRHLCTRFGARAVELIEIGAFGQMVALHPPHVVAVPIADAVGRIRRVPADGELVRTARAIGVGFGRPVGA